MVLIKEIDTKTNFGTVYVTVTTEKREIMVSFCKTNVFQVSVYTTQRLSVGRTFETWAEALNGYKNKNIVAMIRAAKAEIER